MKRRVWMLVILSALAVPAAFAEDELKSSETVPVKSAKGLQFSVPEDWPIEKRGGAVGPIPIEEYMAMKFEKMEGRIKILEEQVRALQPEAAGVHLKSDKKYLKSTGSALPVNPEMKEE